MKKIILALALTASGSAIFLTSMATQACMPPLAEIQPQLNPPAAQLSLRKHPGRLKLGATPPPQLNGCSSNASGCNKTLANLVCTGKSWDPDGDGNYTCKSE